MLRKTIIICLLFAILCPFLLLLLAIEDDPVVTAKRAPDIASAQKTKFLLQSSWDALKQDHRTVLPIRIDDLNAAIGFAGRSTSFLSGHTTLQERSLHVALSLKLPKTPLGHYINLSAQILPSEKGLHLANCRIGSLKISGELALWSVTSLLDLLSDEPLASRLLETVEDISFSQEKIIVTLRSGAEFGRLKSRLLASLKKLISQEAGTEDQQRIAYYLQQLDQLNSGSRYAPTPLSQIMAPFFQQVAHESRAFPPQQENRAALYALAIYLGGWEIYQLNSYLLAPRAPFLRNFRVRYQLVGRDDLRQHFLVSVGIKLLSDAQIGFAVGEFKELLDANPGGSGFSFIDLAADRCGLTFAEKATRSEQSARRFQRQISALKSDQEIFPGFSDLEEGLSEKRFIDRYGNIDSKRYQEVVELIDRRLASLPLYQ